MTRFTPPTPVVPGLRVIEAHFFTKAGMLQCAMVGGMTRKHVCESCKHLYTAEQRERGMHCLTGGDNAENRKKLREKTERHMETIFQKRAPENPCPKCGWLSSAAVKQINGDRRFNATLAASVSFVLPVVFFVMIQKDPPKEGWGTFETMLVLGSLLVAGIITAITYALARKKDPNADAAERKKRQIQAAAGTYGRKGLESIPR